MKIRLMILLWVLFTYASGSAQEACSPNKKVIKELTKLFGDENPVELIPLTMDSATSALWIRENDCIYVLQQKGEVAGYLLSTSARGRFDYFDYSVIYSEKLVVQGVMITVYRSSHGAGICQKKWLQQFVGYSGGMLSLGKEIDAISGATFSTSSLVEDIQRCQQLMASVKKTH